MNELLSQFAHLDKTDNPLALNLFALTHPGNLLDHNEDFLYIEADGRLMILADGMGGHRAGETAARLGVEAAHKFLHQHMPDAASASRMVRQKLKQAMLAAHAAIVDQAGANTELGGMGAVMIIAVLCHNRLYTCHVGDVRAYLWSKGKLQQITQDHSLVAELVKLGRLHKDEMHNHPLRNQVLQALGQQEAPAPENHSPRLHPGDQILLCSDGLWESIDDSAMAQILSKEENAEYEANLLLQQALKNRGQDNISLILYKYVEKS